MDIDHDAPTARHARITASIENLHRALDRAADNPRLLNGGVLTDVARRLDRLAADLSDLTGRLHADLLPHADHVAPGPLFFASAELLAVARASEWWHDQQPSLGRGSEDATGAAYL